MISALLALTSYLIVILVGLTCLAVEKKMHMLISTFTKKFQFWTFCADFFVNVFYSALLKIVWEQIFHFSDNFGQKMWLKEGYAEKKMFSCYFKVNQGHLRLLLFFCIPIGYHVVKNDENMKMSQKDMPHICSQLGNLGPFGPTVKHQFRVQ